MPDATRDIPRPDPGAGRDAGADSRERGPVMHPHAEALAWWARLEAEKQIRWPDRHWDKASLDRLLEDVKNDE